MSDPLSIAQMLSSLSMRTLCANDQPYSCLPTSRTNSPFGPNSSNWAAAAPYAGPYALFDRVKTKMCPFELTATPGTSPKFIPSGSFKKSGTESNGISGASCHLHGQLLLRDACFGVGGARRGRRARRVPPLRIFRRDLRHHRRDGVVARFAGSLELADARLHRLEKRAVARDQRRVADRAVARNDLRGRERRQLIERRQPRA